jgi:hypothetical protein
MFILGCYITIGNYQFTRCNSIEIEKSINLVSNSAKITFPASAVLKSNNEVTTIETAKAIKPGMPVAIKLAYQNVYENVEFSGYVKTLNFKIPLEIECEDAVYLLRQKNINKSWQSITLKDLLKEIIAGTDIKLSSNIPEITISPYSIKNASGAFALQKIKDDYGLSINIDSGVLYCNLAYTDKTGIIKYIINGEQANVINADELKYRRKDDIKLKIKAININGDNTRNEVEFGDDDGELKTLFFYNIKTKEQLEKIARQEINKLKFDGYEGKISTFLIPPAKPGMTAELKDNRFPEREGNYYIEAVKTYFGNNGARREVEIGIKIS